MIWVKRDQGESNSAPPYIFCSNRQACIRFFRPNVRMQILLTFPFCFDGVQLLCASASPNLLCICAPGKKLHFQFSELEIYYPYYDSKKGGRKGKGGKFIFLPWNNIASPHHRAYPPLSIILAACVSLRFLSTQGLNAICSNTLRTWPKSGHIMTL